MACKLCCEAAEMGRLWDIAAAASSSGK